MEPAKRRYWCSNYACPSKENCMRFVDSERPIETIREKRDCVNFLNPFIKGENKKLFYADKYGMCNSFIERKDNKLKV